MPGRRDCERHKNSYPCSCAMGQLYRFVEPVVLLLLKQKGHSYGYDLSNSLSRYAFTDTDIERAALYRTLRQLEQNGYVKSDWDMPERGPARRVYSLTEDGEEHLKQWSEVLRKVSGAMLRFVDEVDALADKGRVSHRKQREQA